jgi:hypothetical protein
MNASIIEKSLSFAKGQTETDLPSRSQKMMTEGSKISRRIRGDGNKNKNT